MKEKERRELRVRVRKMESTGISLARDKTR